MYKIVSFRYESVIFAPPPPNHKSVPTALLRAATNESQKTRNKNQETKRFSAFAVSRLRHSETKKTLLDSRIKFSAKHV